MAYLRQASPKTDELKPMGAEVFFSFHNKLNGNTCSLALYHGYKTIRSHVFDIFEKSIGNFEKILTAEDS